MKKVFLVLKHSFAWHRRDFILTFAMVPVFLFAYVFFRRDADLAVLINLLLVGAMLYSARLIPKVSLLARGQRPSFGLKFLETLPWSRRELILATCAQFIVTGIPMLIFMSLLILNVEKGLVLLKLVGIILAIVLFSTLALFEQNFRLRRLDVLLKSNRFLATQALFRWLLGFLVVVGVSTFVLLRFDFWHGVAGPVMTFIETLGNVVKATLDLFVSWPALPLAVGGLFLFYKKIIREWENEALSYPKQLPGKPYFEVACAVILVALVTYAELSPPFRYAGDDVLTATYRADRAELERVFRTVDVNYVGRNQLRPIMVAAREGDLETFKFLQDRGATLAGKSGKIRDNEGVTVLSAALKSRNQELVLHILKSGYDLNQEVGVHKLHPLQAAASACLEDATAYMLDQGLDINHRDENGDTALHGAARANCLELYSSLLSRGADPYHKNYTGYLASDYSFKVKLDAVAKEDRLKSQRRMPASISK